MKRLFDTGYKAFFIYFSALGFALTLLDALEPLLRLSKIAKLILMYWKEFIIKFWTALLFFIEIDLSPEVYEALTASIFFLALGFFSNERIVSIIRQKPLQFSELNSSLSYLFNIIFLLGFSVVNLVGFHDSTMDVSNFLQVLLWSGPFLVFSYSLFFVSVKISIAPLLRKKILASLAILLTIVALDALYEPLQSFLVKAV